MLNKYIGIIEKGIEDALREGGFPSPMAEAMKYSTEGGGKRLRPSLCLAACEISGGKTDDALPIAVAIELIHSYSLVHDDLPCMDDDDTRRGRPSVHKAFGEAQGVLAGDALLTYAFEWMLKNRPSEKKTLCGYLNAMQTVAENAGAKGMIAGQSIEFTEKMKDGGASIEEVQALKTGALIEASVLAGAYAANADPKTVAALDEFARNYGILFQITDDILDTDDDESKNYALHYGMDAAKLRAEKAADRAKRALDMFGKDGDGLKMLTDKTLARTI